jgi:hypothetical protein
MADARNHVTSGQFDHVMSSTSGLDREGLAATILDRNSNANSTYGQTDNANMETTAYDRTLLVLPRATTECGSNDVQPTTSCDELDEWRYYID